MSLFGDVLKFEGFNLKDMWGKIKDDPIRLLIGGITPLDTKIQNKILGRDDEALVNQMGGAMGGGSWGMDKDGGVYGRAQQAGIDTKAGAGMHSLAEAIASIYAGNYGASKLGGLINKSPLPSGTVQGPNGLPTAGGQSQGLMGMMQGGFMGMPQQQEDPMMEYYRQQALQLALRNYNRR